MKSRFDIVLIFGLEQHFNICQLSAAELSADNLRHRFF